MSQLISQKSIMLTLIIKMNSELKEDGTLNASLNIPTKDPILLPGIYNVVGDKMYVRLNLLEIVKDFGLFDDEATATRASLMDIFSGIPVDIAVNDNVFSVTLTREMLSPFLNLVPMLLPTIEKAEFPNAMAGTFGITGPNLAGFLGEFQRVVSECPKFNIILSFQPSK